MKKSHLFLAFFALLGFFFVSCANEIEDSKTYIVFSQSSRAAEKKAENLTDILLVGKSSAGTLGKFWSKWQDAAGDKIELDAGVWEFTLSAKLDGEKYSDTTTQKIVAGKENAVSFTLSSEIQGIVLKTGSEINKILKELAGLDLSNATNNDVINTECTNGTAFEKSDEKPSSVEYYLDKTQKVPVWFDSESGAIKYYVPSGEKVFMNEYSNALFINMRGLTSIDLSGFDTSKVSNMAIMFANCFSLQKLDLSSFNTSNVKSMLNMFACCSTLTELDVSKFDTSKVTDMSSMFSYCSALKTIYAASNADWSSLTGEKSKDMFYECSKLKNFSNEATDAAKAKVGDDGYFTAKP